MLILKMDVEGAEWDTLSSIPNSVLGLFKQIVVEIHNLHSFKPDYIRNKLIKVEIGL